MPELFPFWKYFSPFDRAYRIYYCFSLSCISSKFVFLSGLLTRGYVILNRTEKLGSSNKLESVHVFQSGTNRKESIFLKNNCCRSMVKVNELFFACKNVSLAMFYIPYSRDFCFLIQVPPSIYKPPKERQQLEEIKTKNIQKAKVSVFCSSSILSFPLSWFFCLVSSSQILELYISAFATNQLMAFSLES